MLKERFIGEYNREKMEKILNAKNPVRCKVSKKNTVMTCWIVK